MTTSAVRRITTGSALLVSSLFLSVSCSPNPNAEVVTFVGPTMGTQYKVRVVADVDPQSAPLDADDLQNKVDQRLAEINRLMSTYDPNSELSRFNRSETTDWFSVSPETVEVVQTALEIAERTNGAFDPTVGPVVNLWGFGPNKSRRNLPADEQIRETLSGVGYAKLQVRNDPPAIQKQVANVYLDLSAIAKGYASDEVSDLLLDMGHRNTMVEIGGEVRTRGRKPGNLPWRIGVQKPVSGGDPLQMTLPLTDAAMATSGDYRNYFEYEGIRYSHTIDPSTGRPVDHDLASVTIVADTCMEADAVATAVLVMGDDQGYDWCEQQGIAALFLVRETDGVVEIRSSKISKLIEQN